MSDLQLGLALVGAIVIVAVIAYNKWQEARLSKRSQADFGSRHEDVLVRKAAADADPAPAAVAARAGAAVDAPSVDRIEHTFGGMDAPPLPHAAPVPMAQWPNHVALHDRIDCIVTLECARPVTGMDAIAAARGLLGDGWVKPLRWEGGDADAGTWGPLTAAQRYTHVRAGVQLADRSGAVTAAELEAFFEGMQEAALALAGAADFPDPDAALAAAQALDAFCADVDVQIGLNVIATADQPFPGTKLRALAEAGGLRLADDGMFHRFDEAGHELFSLANGEATAFHPETLRTLATHGVTVTLDVPRAPGSASTFRLYLDFARQLEQALGGMLVDDHKKPVGQAALDTIGRQLDQIYRAMDAQGIPAGSPAALRLFA